MEESFRMHRENLPLGRLERQVVQRQSALIADAARDAEGGWLGRCLSFFDAAQLMAFAAIQPFIRLRDSLGRGKLPFSPVSLCREVNGAE